MIEKSRYVSRCIFCGWSVTVMDCDLSKLNYQKCDISLIGICLRLEVLCLE